MKQFGVRTHPHEHVHTPTFICSHLVSLEEDIIIFPSPLCEPALSAVEKEMIKLI